MTNSAPHRDGLSIVKQGPENCRMTDPFPISSSNPPGLAHMLVSLLVMVCACAGTDAAAARATPNATLHSLFMWSLLTREIGTRPRIVTAPGAGQVSAAAAARCP